MTDTIQFRRATAATAQSDNPTLAPGEPGFEIDTHRFAIGDGSTSWENLRTIHTDTALIEAGAATLTLQYKICIFTDTHAQAWTLPVVATSTGAELVIKNRGTATLTLEPGGEDAIFSTSAVESYFLVPGQSAYLVCDGYFWVIVTSPVNVVAREVPTGAANGSNAVFTVAQAPIAGTETVFVNGLLANPTTYTVSGSSVTFNSAPANGAVILIGYQHS